MAFNVVGLGEVLWDLLPTGPQLGGAPTNFAYHARALGASSRVVTRIGCDELGEEVIRRFNQSNLPGETLQVDHARRTGTVTVTVDAEGAPNYTFAEEAAWEYLEATNSAFEAVRKAHALCFGTLGQRGSISRSSIQQLIAAAPPGTLKIFDVNLRLRFYSRELIEQSMRLANILKLNDEELDVLTAMFSLSGDLRSRVEHLAGEFGFLVVVVTKGASGSLIHQQGRWSEQRSRPIGALDTVGAGDAFAAAVTMGLLNGVDLAEIHVLAEEVARFVCSRNGATPPMPDAFRMQLQCERRRRDCI